MSSYLEDNTSDGCRDLGSFFLDVVGRYAPKNVRVLWSDQPRPSNKHIDRLIEQTWGEESSRADRLGVSLFDGSLCRLINCTVEEGCLTLTTGPVTYKEFLGTNLFFSHLRYIHGPEVLANALGVSAAIVTSDGFLVLGRRSTRVFYYPGLIHPVGGMVESVTPQAGPPDPFRTVIEELAEEVNIAPELVRENVCIGLVRDKNIDQPELIFEVTVAVDVQTLHTLMTQAASAEEHAELVPIRNNPTAVVSFIEQNHPKLTPVSLATLLLYGMYHWGSGWLATARGYLSKVI